jgi:hypothetical protein
MVTTFSFDIFGPPQPLNQTRTVNRLQSNSLIHLWQIDSLSNTERSAAIYLLDFRYQGT